MRNRVSIESAAVIQRNGKREDGTRWETTEQEAFLHVPGSKYPRNCVIRLEDGQKPYQPGEYETDAILIVGQFNRLQVSYDLGLEKVAAGK